MPRESCYLEQESVIRTPLLVKQQQGCIPEKGARTVRGDGPWASELDQVKMKTSSRKGVTNNCTDGPNEAQAKQLGQKAGVSQSQATGCRQNTPQ